MRKVVNTNVRLGKRGWRLLAVTSLAVTLAAFGCTTNRYPGSGQPTSVTPSYGATHSLTPGSSYGTEGVPPMASSYTGIPRVNVDALAILAAEQGFRGRILGPVNPAGIQTAVPIQPFGGQVVNPAMIANPQATINSSISSQPIPAITAGTAGNGVTIGVPAATTAATGAALAVATAPAGATAATAAATIPATAALTTSTGAGIPITAASQPTVAGSAVFSPALMNSTPAPSATGGLTPMLPTIQATGRAVPVSNAIRSGSTGTRTGVTTAALTARSATTSAPLVMGFAPIRIDTGTKGQITVTNVSTTPTAPATTATTTPAPTTRY